MPKIKQQLKENKSLVDEIAKREDAFEAIKKAAADVIAKSPTDPAVKGVISGLPRWTLRTDISVSLITIYPNLHYFYRYQEKDGETPAALERRECSNQIQEPVAERGS